MTSNGIKDQVAIVGMGCIPFREHWDMSQEDMLIQAVNLCLQSVDRDPEVGKQDVDAYWVGTAQGGNGGLILSQPLQLEGKPVTRVENFCATGSEALRNAAYAVASGAYDVVMAVGVEKVKDSGYQGLNAYPSYNDGTKRNITAAAMFSLVIPAYAQKYEVPEAEVRKAIAEIGEKNHFNGTLNPLAQFRKGITAEEICEMPDVAGKLSVLDCAGVADGAAAALLVNSERAHLYTDNPVYIKALSFVSGKGDGNNDPHYDYTHFPECEQAAKDAYEQVGISHPASEISMAEVHDCFTVAELILMEDLGFSKRGMAWKDVQEGRYKIHGELPINPDGGLKAFGHPVGASGLRMHYECWLQLRREAEVRQVDDPKLALVHNLGGYPGEMVSFVSILGNEYM